MSAEQDRADERSTELQADLRIFLMRWVRKHKVGSWEGIAALALELANMANGNDIEPDQVILSFIECHNRTFPRHAIACNFEEPHAPETPVCDVLELLPRSVSGLPVAERFSLEDRADLLDLIGAPLVPSEALDDA